MVSVVKRSDIDALKSLDWERAAKFYSESPDGQYDDIAHVACSLMPYCIDLLEGVLNQGEKKGQVIYG